MFSNTAKNDNSMFAEHLERLVSLIGNKFKHNEFKISFLKQKHLDFSEVTLLNPSFNFNIQNFAIHLYYFNKANDLVTVTFFTINEKNLLESLSKIIEEDAHPRTCILALNIEEQEPVTHQPIKSNFFVLVSN